MKGTTVKLVTVFTSQGEPVDVMNVEERDAWSVMEAISKIRCEGLEDLMTIRFWSKDGSEEWSQELEDIVLREWKTNLGNFKKVSNDLAWIQFYSDDYIFILGDECTWFDSIEKFETWDHDLQELFLQYCSVTLNLNWR